MNKILAQAIVKLCLVNGFSLCGTSEFAADIVPIDSTATAALTAAPTPVVT